MATREREEEVESRALVQGLRRGDEGAFRDLVETHQPRMLAVARRILRNEEEARDACQDAFLAVVRSMHRFGENSRLGTWIHAIVVNSCLMRLRTKRRRPEMLSSALPGRGLAGDWAENIPAPHNDPAKRMDARRELRRLAHALAMLPPGYSEVLVLRFVLERSAKQTARILKTTPNAVQIRVHRARQALASTYGGKPLSLDRLPDRVEPVL